MQERLCPVIFKNVLYVCPNSWPMECKTLKKSKQTRLHVGWLDITMYATQNSLEIGKKQCHFRTALSFLPLYSSSSIEGLYTCSSSSLHFSVNVNKYELSFILVSEIYLVCCRLRSHWWSMDASDLCLWNTLIVNAQVHRIKFME